MKRRVMVESAPPQLYALEEEGCGAGELVTRWAKVMKSRFRVMIVILGDREYEGGNSRSSLESGGVYRLRPSNSGFRIESQILVTSLHSGRIYHERMDAWRPPDRINYHRDDNISIAISDNISLHCALVMWLRTM